MRDRSFRDVREAHQPVAPTHDRRHDGAPIQGEGSERLRPAREEVRNLPRPVAGHGDERGPSPISTPHGAAAGQPVVYQLRHRRAAILLHRDARTAQPRSPFEARDRAAQDAHRPEPGGSGAPYRSRARPQVQGRSQRRLRRGSSGVRGREPEGVGHRQPAHDAPGRAGQGAAGSRCDAVAATARTVARVVEGGAAAGVALSRPEPDQSDHPPPDQPRRHRRKGPGRHLQARVASRSEATSSAARTARTS